MPTAIKLAALLVAFATIGTAPATAAPLRCDDKKIIEFVNKGINSNATWENGDAANSKGALRIVGKPRTEQAKKNLLVCGIQIHHTDRSNGATEVLRARLWVSLNRDGSISNADIKFLEGSK